MEDLAVQYVHRMIHLLKVTIGCFTDPLKEARFDELEGFIHHTFTTGGKTVQLLAPVIGSVEFLTELLLAQLLKLPACIRHGHMLTIANLARGNGLAERHTGFI